MPRIDSCTLADLPVLRQLLHEYLREFDPRQDPELWWDEEYIAACARGIASGTHCILLLKEHSAAIGLVIAHLETPWYRQAARLGMVDEFYVVPDWRHQGYGTMLAARMIRELRAAGAVTITASVVLANARVLPFWQQLGFRNEAFHLFLREV